MILFLPVLRRRRPLSTYAFETNLELTLTISSKSWSSSTLGVLIKWSYSMRFATKRFLLSASQVIFFVVLKSLSSGRYSPVRLNDPSALAYLVKIITLPQFMSVTFSPTFKSWSASSNSIRIFFDLQRGLVPRALLSLFCSTVTASGYSEALVIISLEAFSRETAANLGQIGSIILLLIAHNFYHSIKLALFEGPCSNMNSIRVSIRIPFLRTPLKVGKRGSSHP